MPRVVILGGGFGGLRVARDLARRRNEEQLDITLVDASPVHVYTPLLYEVATGFLLRGGRVVEAELRDGVSVSLRDVAARNGFHFRQAIVRKMDHARKEITLDSGEMISYDAVVIALGSVPAFFDISGAAEYAIPLKTFNHALAIRQRIRTFLAAYEKGEEKRLSFLLVGGGPAGVECACELANFFHGLVRCCFLCRKDVEIAVVEAGEHILPSISSGMRAVALARLARLHVRVHTRTRVALVKASSVTFADGTTHDADVLIWSAGVQPSPVAEDLGVPLTDRGSIIVDTTLAVPSAPGVFALGDAAAVLDTETGRPAPLLAQAAVEQARTVAENVRRFLSGESPRRLPSHERWTTIIPLGGAFAVTEIHGLIFKGWLGYVSRKCVDLVYFLSVLPWRVAIRLWWRGAKTYRKNDIE